jgi:hypothetical protein
VSQVHGGNDIYLRVENQAVSPLAPFAVAGLLSAYYFGPWPIFIGLFLIVVYHAITDDEGES